MARKLGTGNLTKDGEVMVESLTGLNNLEAAQKIGEHFSKISNEYQPIDNTDLPCYLPAPMPPQLEEYDVYLRLKKIKKTKSTLPMDIPDSIRQGCEVFLAEPLTIIFNNTLFLLGVSEVLPQHHINVHQRQTQSQRGEMRIIGIRWLLRPQR